MNREERAFLRGDVLSACLVEHRGVLASGAEANNKFDAELLVPDPRSLSQPEYQRIVQIRHELMLAMGEIVVRHNPDLLVPIPEGANWIAFQLSNLFNKPAMYSTVNEQPDGTKGFVLPPNVDEVMEGKRAMLVDDVFTTGSSARKLMKHMGRHQPFVLATILDRSDREARRSFELPVDSVFREPIPHILSPESRYRRYMTT